MHVAELIERKRNGEELSAAHVREFIDAYVAGDVPDYRLRPSSWRSGSAA